MHQPHFIPHPGFALAQIHIWGGKLATAKAQFKQGKISETTLIQARIAYEAAVLNFELCRPKDN